MKFTKLEDARNKMEIIVENIIKKKEDVALDYETLKNHIGTEDVIATMIIDPVCRHYGIEYKFKGNNIIIKGKGALSKLSASDKGRKIENKIRERLMNEFSHANIKAKNKVNTFVVTINNLGEYSVYEFKKTNYTQELDGIVDEVINLFYTGVKEKRVELKLKGER